MQFQIDPFRVFFLLRTHDGDGSGGGCELEEGEGWSRRSGWWAERPPARSAAVGVVAGRTAGGPATGGGEGECGAVVDGRRGGKKG